MSQRKRTRQIQSEESDDDELEVIPQRSQKRRRVANSDEEDGDTQGTQGTQKKQQITQQEKQKLIGEMMRFLLFSESHKKPLRKDEINKNVMKNYKNRKLYDEIFDSAKEELLQTFGYEVVALIPEGEKKTSNTHYAMINKLAGNPLLLEYVPVPDAKELILLTTILDMIYINDEALDQDVLYEQLRLLGFYKSEAHPVYGDWDKLITNWIRTGYITRRRNDAGREGQASYDYILGPRALHVVTRKNLLKHVAVVFNEEVDPIRAKELEDKERENQRNVEENNAGREASESQDQAASQTVPRPNNNNTNTFRPPISLSSHASSANGRPSATYSKRGQPAKAQRGKNNNSSDDSDD